MTRIVVTGGNGYIGRHCLELLQSTSAEVHCLSRSEPKGGGDNVLWHKLDLLTQSAQSLFQEIRPTHLLHLAWCTEHGAYWSSPSNSDWLASSIQLVKDFHNAGGTRFVNAGTCAEYSWGGICEEGVTEEKPATFYGQCKKMFSDFLQDYSRTSHLSTATGRIFFLYGPDESPKRIVPSVIAALLMGETARCTDGRQIRDFMFVRDVARALLALLNSQTQGVVNVASGSPVTLGAMISQIESQLGLHSRVAFGAVPRNADDPDELIAVTKRLNHEVGFKPTVCLQTGLAQSIRSIRDNLGTQEESASHKERTSNHA